MQDRSIYSENGSVFFPSPSELVGPLLRCCLPHLLQEHSLLPLMSTSTNTRLHGNCVVTGTEGKVWLKTELCLIIKLTLSTVEIADEAHLVYFAADFHLAWE